MTCLVCCQLPLGTCHHFVTYKECHFIACSLSILIVAVVPYFIDSNTCIYRFICYCESIVRDFAVCSVSEYQVVNLSPDSFFKFNIYYIALFYLYSPPCLYLLVSCWCCVLRNCVCSVSRKRKGCPAVSICCCSCSSSLLAVLCYLKYCSCKSVFSICVCLDYCNRRSIYLFSFLRCVCDNKTTSRTTCYCWRIAGYCFFLYSVFDFCSIVVLWKIAEGSFPVVGFAQRQCLATYSFVVRLELYCYAFRSCIPRLSRKL